MSYAPNGTLRLRHPKGQRLQVIEVLSYVQQVASALDYAHQQKLIHRDIKPENMLLGQHNEVLLSDFGLVLIAQSTGSQTMKEMAGTVPYMAPEQLQGRASPASDQYALGIIVYEWLSGERPFQGSFAEVASQHLLTPPPPLHGRIPGISAEVEKVVFTALAKDPQQRFPNVQAFATALAQACNRGQEPLLATPLTSSPPHNPAYATLPMNPLVQPSTSINRNTSLNWSSQPTPIITPPNQSQLMAAIPSQQNQPPQPSPITPSNLSSWPTNMNPPPPYEQRNNKKRNNLSKGKVALLIGLVLLVLGGSIASFIVKWGPTTAATCTPASPGTASHTSDMSLVPLSMQPLCFTGWDYGTKKVILPPMRKISAGPFLMGSDLSHDPMAQPDEAPINQVTLPNYQIGTYEVTVAEYALAFKQGAVRQLPDGPVSDPHSVTWQTQLNNLNHPLVRAVWADMMRYTTWLAQVTGQQWRVSSEAEWEKAARWDPTANHARKYPWGDQWDPSRANTVESGSPGITPVGAYPSDASYYGVQDMVGNVFQWVASLHKPYPYVANDGREDPSQLANGSSNILMIRGASWFNLGFDNGRSAQRGCCVNPLDTLHNAGFRLVLSGPSA